MSDLAQLTCKPCRKGDSPLSEAEISDLLISLPEWQINERESINQLERSFQFPDFKKALEFTNQLGALAEEEDHHPAIRVSWGRAAVSWWTFEIDGLHLNDFILAARTDQLYQSISQK